jgi:hypothetical protein
MHKLFIFITLLLVVSCTRSIEYIKTYNIAEITDGESWSKNHASGFEVTVIFNFNEIPDQIKLIVENAGTFVYKPLEEVENHDGCREYDAVSNEHEKTLIVYCEDLDIIVFYSYGRKSGIRYIRMDIPKEHD